MRRRAHPRPLAPWHDEVIGPAARALVELAGAPPERRREALALVVKVMIERPEFVDELAREACED